MAIRQLPSTGDKPRSTGVPASLVPGGSGDSAGYPWAGRTFAHHDTTFADDTGEMPAGWRAALDQLHAAAGEYLASDRSTKFRDATAAALAAGRVPAAVCAAVPEVAFVAAAAARQALVAAQRAAVHELSKTRLLVPLVTDAGDIGVTPEGKHVDKTQELAIAFVASPDGRKALPVFSSVAAMREWDATARPIPVPAPQAAVSAAEEGAQLLVVDPGQETEFALRFQAMRALSLGEAWEPAWADVQVGAAVLRECAPLLAVSGTAAGGQGVPAWLGLAAETLDPYCRLAGPELAVNLLVDWDGFAAERVRDIGAQQLGDAFKSAFAECVARIQGSEYLRQVTDSLQIAVCLG